VVVDLFVKGFFRFQRVFETLLDPPGLADGEESVRFSSGGEVREKAHLASVAGVSDMSNTSHLDQNDLLVVVVKEPCRV